MTVCVCKPSVPVTGADEDEEASVEEATEGDGGESEDETSGSAAGEGEEQDDEATTTTTSPPTPAPKGGGRKEKKKRKAPSPPPQAESWGFRPKDVAGNPDFGVAGAAHLPARNEDLREECRGGGSDRWVGRGPLVIRGADSGGRRHLGEGVAGGVLPAILQDERGRCRGHGLHSLGPGDPAGLPALPRQDRRMRHGHGSELLLHAAPPEPNVVPPPPSIAGPATATTPKPAANTPGCGLDPGAEARMDGIEKKMSEILDKLSGIQDERKGLLTKRRHAPDTKMANRLREIVQDGEDVDPADLEGILVDPGPEAAIQRTAPETRLQTWYPWSFFRAGGRDSAKAALREKMLDFPGEPRSHLRYDEPGDLPGPTGFDTLEMAGEDFSPYLGRLDYKKAPHLRQYLNSIGTGLCIWGTCATRARRTYWQCRSRLVRRFL